MKKAIQVLLLCALFLSVLVLPSCKSALVWDPTGTWTVIVTYVNYSVSYSETFILSGSDSSGMVTGYTLVGSFADLIGTYTKTADFAITFSFDFSESGYYHELEFTGTSSEDNPNTITGSGLWNVDGTLYCNLTWTATKITNLQ